ncbi:hypothetical protein SKAU_G00355670 [Synaphobranchus kaupii]|uniref:DUF4657 domain-containing protein n=1 Tax=Synaphobranchus kaupii TaxID=118154 RepID=A0A9Q1EH94_SYNKA|nr:hypothetical protein SKAU_G00355670 [Synaphobranchus kaupii]
MNLCRNFGSMLEIWVATTDLELNSEDADVVECKSPTLSAKAEGVEGQAIQGLGAAILRSESEDSGVETACSETENSPSTSGSLDGGFSTAKGMEEREPGAAGEDGSSRLLSSSSRSSSSSSLNAAAPETPEPAKPSVRVEQALSRAALSSRRVPRKAPSQLCAPHPLLRAYPGRLNACHMMGPLLRCQSMVSLSGLGQRSGPRGIKIAVPPLTASRQVPGLPKPRDFLKEPLPRSPQPCLTINESDSHSHCEEEGSLHALKSASHLREGLSPGLGYLEQVCKMLEEIARLQSLNQELRRENERAQNRQEAPSGCQQSLLCQHHSVCPGNPVVIQSLDTEECKDLSDQPSQEVLLLPPHIRQRSMSDTRGLTRHKGVMEGLGQLNRREGERPDECDSLPPSMPQQGRTNLVLKLKTGSLNREATLENPPRQPASPSGKNGVKRFAMLFKKKVKNTPAS